MKPKYKMDKRQKELARKRKQERKAEEKLQRREQSGSSPEGHETPPADDVPTE